MEAQQNIVKALTEEPIIFEVKPIRTGISKLLVRLKILKATRRFTIYPATAGMIEQMAEYSNRLNIPKVDRIGDAVEIFAENSMDLFRYLAVAILRVSNGPVGRFRIELLAKYLHHNLSAKSTSSLMDVVIKNTDIAFFLSIINSIAPKKEKESQEKLTALHGESQEE